MNAAGAARAITVGTAGHVDHGKTSLVLALTGIDCDRLPEEKRRGMTLDLGFAHSEIEGARIGFVDVPGHVDYLPNALAGLGGLEAVLLVVAANEGIRPQTEEHLEIARLLEVPKLLVALSKIDLVDREALELRALELEERLARSRYAGSPIYPVSARTGEGLAALSGGLARLARESALPPLDRPARLPVDRVFSLPGRGLVVTGTLREGSIRAGASLEVLPGGRRLRVREVQVHGWTVDVAFAGERTALRLGSAPAETLKRGAELLSPGSARTSRRLLLEVTWLPSSPPLEGPVAVEAFLNAGSALGRLVPAGDQPLGAGQTGLAELRLREPLVLVRGDRLVLRQPSPPRTLGGGRVLDPRYHRPKRELRSQALARLAASTESAVRVWVERSGWSGLPLDELRTRLFLSEEELRNLLRALRQEGRLVASNSLESLQVPIRLFAPESLRTLELHVLERLPALWPDSGGLALPEFERRALPRTARPQGDFHLAWLSARGHFRLERDRVLPPGDSPRAASHPVSRKLLEILERRGLSAARANDLAEEVGVLPGRLSSLLEDLVREGEVLRLPDGWLAHRTASERLRKELRATGWRDFSVPEFKDRFGLSRKLAIPWLEYLDNVRVTLRLGDRRRILDTGAGTGPEK